MAQAIQVASAALFPAILKVARFGYDGKGVRDNIHSHDLVEAFWQFMQAPRSGEVYNIGGSRHSNCSMIEAIKLCEEISGKKLEWSYKEDNRIGDHIWWISDVAKFQSHYPDWKYKYDLRTTLEENLRMIRETALGAAARSRRLACSMASGSMQAWMRRVAPE